MGFEEVILASCADPSQDPMEDHPPMPPPMAPRDAPFGDSARQGRDPLMAASDLQDHLLIASHDLDRLLRLLTEAGDALMTHFHAAAGQMKQVRQELGSRTDVNTQAMDVALEHLAGAITSLQFQDMASQLLTHTGHRLRGCADRLAADVMDGDEDGDAFLDDIPLRPNPVTQDEMDAGSIELF
jgi:hypothetical protein